MSMRRSLPAIVASQCVLIASAHAQCTGANASDQYISGLVEGSAATMHWSTGLVWQRCMVGQSGSDCSGGALETRPWNDWMRDYMPRSFTGQDSWWPPVLIEFGVQYYPNPTIAPVGIDRLTDGNWRMPYLRELFALTENCTGIPRSNADAFPNAASGYVWSASPGSLSDARLARSLNFTTLLLNTSLRSNSSPTRLVRGGQAFANLVGPSTPHNVAANTQATFTVLISTQS